MSEWKNFCLGDVCSRLSSGKNIKSKEIHNVGLYPVYGGNGIRGYTENYNFTGECAIIGRQGAYCGNVRFFSGKAYMTEHAVVVCGNELCDTRFLAYKLSKMNLSRLSSQSAQPGLSVKTLEIQNLNIPPLDTQKKIAAVLGALDDKIELNNAINKNLEEQAQAIYKDMFVDNFNPAWRSGTLSDIAEIKSGKRPLDRFEKESEVAFVPIFGASSIMGYTTSVLSNKKILITGRVGTHGIIQRYNKPCWVSDNAFIITSNYYEYIFQILHSINYNNLNRGSTQPLLTQKDLKKFIIIIPDEKILTKFEDVVGYLMSMHDENIEQNRKLGEMRDALLPRLMSGEIDVSKVEQRR